MKLVRPFKAISIIALSLSLLSACGNSNFQTQGYNSTSTTSGNNDQVITKAKVDIVIFQDNSDSVMFGPINQVKSQMYNFLANLNQDADFRVVVLPLLSNQSVGSKYVFASDCSSVTVGTCLSPSQIGTFNGAIADQGWITSVNSSIGSSDYGFANMINNINNTGMLSGSNRFLRSDAQTVIMMFTNGDDIDGAQYSTRSDGVVTLSSYNDTNFNSYVSYFRNLKAGSGINFYPVVAGSTSCYGYASRYGSRYVKMASSLNTYKGGTASVYDLCGNQIETIMSNINSKVKTLVQAVQYDYVMISPSRGTPDVGTMKVTKNGVSIPQSNVNGWQYVGYVENQATSYYPTSGNTKSGYALKLNGTARYSGTDVIAVNFDENVN